MKSHMVKCQNMNQENHRTELPYTPIRSSLSVEDGLQGELAARSPSVAMTSLTPVSNDSSTMQTCSLRLDSGPYRVVSEALRSAIAVFEVSLFAFLGNVVDWLSEHSPETFFEAGRELLEGDEHHHQTPEWREMGSTEELVMGNV